MKSWVLWFFWIVFWACFHPAQSSKDGVLAADAGRAPARLAQAGQQALPGTAGDIQPARVLVEYFYTPGCEECREIEADTLPRLRELMEDDIDLRLYDIFNQTNYLRLAALQDKTGAHTTERVSVYVDEKVHLGSLKAITDELIPTVEAAVLARAERGSQTTDAGRQRTEYGGSGVVAVRQAPPERFAQARANGIGTGETAEIGPSSAEDRKSIISLQPAAQSLKPIAPGEAVLRSRLDAMTATTVALAGLMDGLNPCAFATLIFFMTLLAVAGKRGRELIAVGISFCGAVFLTYFLLGFGVFHAIQQLSAYHLAGETIRWAMIAALVILGLLSFKDAWAFGKTGQARAVILQLPDTIRNRIHSIMRGNLAARRLVLGSFAIGFLVTLLESVCTGQVYVPTLVYLSRHTETGRQAFGLLIIYNVMFVVPHIAVFTAAYQGMTNERLLVWSRTNMVASKILLGLGFAGLAMLLVWL